MNLLTDNIKHVFRRYMITAFGSALITSIYSLVDMVCVGQFEGPTGSAAGMIFWETSMILNFLVSTVCIVNPPFFMYYFGKMSAILKHPS